MTESAPLYCTTGDLCQMGCTPAKRDCEGIAFSTAEFMILRRRLIAAEAKVEALNKALEDDRHRPPVCYES